MTLVCKLVKYISDSKLVVQKSIRKKLQRGLCLTFISSVKWNQADHVMDITQQPGSV